MAGEIDEAVVQIEALKRQREEVTRRFNQREAALLEYKNAVRRYEEMEDAICQHLLDAGVGDGLGFPAPNGQIITYFVDQYGKLSTTTVTLVSELQRMAK